MFMLEDTNHHIVVLFSGLDTLILLKSEVKEQSQSNLVCHFFLIMGLIMCNEKLCISSTLHPHLYMDMTTLLHMDMCYDDESCFLP